MDICAFIDAVVNDGSDEDDNATQDFVWENMRNYKGQRENFWMRW
jgi:cytochrome c556